MVNSNRQKRGGNCLLSLLDTRPWLTSRFWLLGPNSLNCNYLRVFQNVYGMPFVTKTLFLKSRILRLKFRMLNLKYEILTVPLKPWILLQKARRTSEKGGNAVVGWRDPLVLGK